MLTLYFSGTGNTKYVAELFSQKMGAKCFSIEEDVNFSTEMNAHDTIAFCYPIYGSRVPHIMRVFVHKHMADIVDKKIVILATQQAFSGDGARVFIDLFKDGTIEVIYAEHFNMQQNVGNIPVWSALFTPSDKSKAKDTRKTERKLDIVCKNIKKGKVKKRGFNKISEILGYIQGKPWQRKTNEVTPTRLEKKVIEDLRVHEDCTACNLCIDICPAKNLLSHEGKIEHRSNCTVCYRCVNRCPQKAITVYIHRKPKWQYFRV